jgi:hypothetical protein
MKMYRILIIVIAGAGLTLAISFPIGRFLFSGMATGIVIRITSWLQIYGDEDVGDFLVNVTLSISLFLAILSIFLFIWQHNRKRKNVE